MSQRRVRTAPPQNLSQPLIQEAAFRRVSVAVCGLPDHLRTARGIDGALPHVAVDGEHLEAAVRWSSDIVL